MDGERVRGAGPEGRGGARSADDAARALDNDDDEAPAAPSRFAGARPPRGGVDPPRFRSHALSLTKLTMRWMVVRTTGVTLKVWTSFLL